MVKGKSFCAAEYSNQTDCNQSPYCTWVNGKSRKYCRKKTNKQLKNEIVDVAQDIADHPLPSTLIDDDAEVGANMLMHQEPSVKSKKKRAMQSVKRLKNVYKPKRTKTLKKSSTVPKKSSTVPEGPFMRNLRQYEDSDDDMIVSHHTRPRNIVVSPPSSSRKSARKSSSSRRRSKSSSRKSSSRRKSSSSTKKKSRSKSSQLPALPMSDTSVPQPMPAPLPSSSSRRSSVIKSPNPSSSTYLSAQSPSIVNRRSSSSRKSSSRKPSMPSSSSSSSTPVPRGGLFNAWGKFFGPQSSSTKYSAPTQQSSAPTQQSSAPGDLMEDVGDALYDYMDDDLPSPSEQFGQQRSSKSSSSSSPQGWYTYMLGRRK